MTICPHESLEERYNRENGLKGIFHDHVSLDWDGATDPPRRFYLYDGKGSAEITCIHWRQSASRKGLHVLVCFKNELTALQKFLFRFWNHDDIWRLSYDILRYDESQSFEETDKGAGQYAEGTLFDEKNRRKVGPWQT